MFDFFTKSTNVELFRKVFLGTILENYLSNEVCSEAVFTDLDFRDISLDILEERKFLIPFNRWKSLQKSKTSLVQNVFWNVCDTKNLAHHEIRDSINEVNENLCAQDFELASFISNEQNGNLCCFWLFTRKIDNEKFFNATVMVLPRIGDLFEFDENGNCIHK